MTLRFIPFHLLLCCSAPAAVWTSGHGDLVLRYTAAPQPAFSHQWTVGTGGDPATVDGGDVFDATYSATSLIPELSARQVTSPDAVLTGGGLLYLVPQDGTDASLLGSPFQGWSTGVIPGGLFTNNQILLRLIGVNGPGAVSLWSDDSFGGSNFHWASSNGFTGSDTLTLSIGGHSHFNLGFTQPGEYSLEVLASGILEAGGSVSTPLTLRYSVVPESSTGVLLALTAALSQIRRRSQASEV